MTLFYCPKCNKEQLLPNNPYKTEQTIINMRDGYGRVIQHYKCECGNYLAGNMNVTDWDEQGISYAKTIIKDYNENGIYYSPDMLEKAKCCYEKRHKI
jgi:hypothetical protein